MLEEPILDYSTIFGYVGQLYVESRHEVQKLLVLLKQKEEEYSQKISKVEQERDAAIRAIQENVKKINNG